LILAISTCPGDIDRLGGFHHRPTLALWIGRPAGVPSSSHSNAPASRAVDGTVFSELTADDAKDIAVDRTTHLLTAFEQINSTGTWGKRWV
jgi:hypothetical protein